MPRKSAGLMLYRETSAGLQVLLVHPGGPFWRNKDDGVWTIPKGEIDDDEDALAAAKREFEEETGMNPPASQLDALGRENYIPLKPIKQANRKIVHAWAVNADFNPDKLKSNSFQIEWPPRSGRTQEFPEVDRAAWFTPEVASRKVQEGQGALIVELLAILALRSHDQG